MVEATTLLLTRAGNLALLRPLDGASSVVLGSQNDNEAHSLRIVRDAEFDPCNLLLHFDEGQVLLGVENDFTLPRAITQKARNHLSVSILSGDSVVEHTNIVTLLMRPCHADAADIEPLPEIGTELLQQAGTQLVQDGGDLVLLGLGGQERGRVSIGAVTQGAVGPKGDKGDPGADGAPGKDGALGKEGSPGPKGDKGDPGADGGPGPMGDPGADGATGKDGPPGPKGDKGESGADGAPGLKGDKGEPGADGAPGPKGDKGEPGADGAPGPKGDKGDPGTDGAPGVDGQNYPVPMIAPDKTTALELSAANPDRFVVWVG